MEENDEIIDSLLDLYFFSKIVGTKESKDGYTYFFMLDDEFDDESYSYNKVSVVRAKNGVLYIFPLWFLESEFLNYIPDVTRKNILNYVFEGFKKRYPELKLEKRDEWFDYAFEGEIR